MSSSRLLNLLLVLQARQRATTADLARELEVSPRTVLRDVEALSAAGVPVYAERGRGGGIVLLPGARINGAHLDPGEIDLLSVSGLDPAQATRLGLAATQTTAARKLAARHGRSDAGGDLADLVIVDHAPWLSGDEDDGADVGALAMDLRRGTRLELQYRHSGQRRPAERTVDPYGLVAKAGRWYLVADHRGEPDLFAVERIAAYRCLDVPSHHADGRTLKSVWPELREAVDAPGSEVITVRLRASRVDLARRILGARLRAVEPKASGWCVAQIAYPDVESVRQLLQFADHIEVLEPPAARARIAELAADLAARHRG